MNVTRGAVRRPVLTSIIFMIVIALGLISYSRLSIDLMPEITYPTISVVTRYSDVGPQEMEELVTKPIEEALAAVQGVEEISSTSTEGQSRVRVSFDWGTDLDVAANDIRDRIDRITSRLPDDIERPRIRKFDLTAFPILILGISSNMNPLDMRQFVDDQVKYRLERVPGVASVDIWGGLNREIHVDLKAAQLKALELSTDRILSALRSENRNIPAGLFEKGTQEVLVRTQGEYRSLDEIRDTVVAFRQGTPIRIRDVADVVDSFEDVRRLNFIDGKPGLRLSISKQSGANTVRVAQAVNAEIEQINLDFPLIRVDQLIDTSVYIKQSINNIGYALMIGGMLALLALFLFLRNISSTSIIATAIPVSIIATFGLMYFSDFTLNIITFGGLALGIGMLLDNSIVVLENIYRHREAGEEPVAAALEGTSEVWSAIMASTLTTVVVFLPVVFMRGMSVVMYQQMAFVVAFALLCSLTVALSLIPMLSSKFLHHRPSGHYEGESRLHRIYSSSEGTFRRVEKGYGRLLGWALGHRKTVVFLAVVLFSIAVALVRLIGVELMPAADEGEVEVSLEMAVGTRMEFPETAVRAVEEIIRKEVPETALMLSRVGGGFRSRGSHTAQIRARLVPIKERERSSAQVAGDLRKKLTGIPGVTIRVREGHGLFLLRMGSSSSDRINVEVRGYDLIIAQELAQKVEAAVKKVDGITDTRISREEGSPEQVIRIDRKRAADLGLSISDIGEALQTTVGGKSASQFREKGKEYRILVRLSEGDRKDLDNLLDLTVVNNRGEPVILRNVVEARPQEGPVRLERKDQERTITIRAEYADRDKSSVMADIREQLRLLAVPKDFAVLFGGDYEEEQKAFRELIIGFILAIFMVYMVMAGQFESFRDPFIVLFSIPMALIGVTATMILSGTVFSMQAFVGCIMLAGIVVNNAILLVDNTNRLRRVDNLPMMEAVSLAGSRRLRPILMTTITTMLGLFPLSLGLGEGGEAQAPLARVVIGGLASSALITLVLVPVVYSIFQQKRKPGKSRKA